MPEFVNPYTFVPHDRDPARRPPSGHEEMGSGRFSGVLKVRLTVKTPLVIGGFGEDGSDLVPVPRQAAGDHLPIIPGSGLLGSVRSVHEALAGGCLRVLNAGFVPVHRHPASTWETAGLRLALVTQVDAKGKALAVQVCEDWMRVPLLALAMPSGRLPTTGDQLRHQAADGRATPIPAAAITSEAGRRTLHVMSETFQDGVRPGSMVPVAGMRPVTEDCWVLLVTDTRARDARLPVHFVAGRFGRDSRPYRVPPVTWGRYQDTVAGADDLRPATLISPENPKGQEPPYELAKPRPVEVVSPADWVTPVASRLPARKYLYRGQPAWVKVDESTGEVTEIRLAMLWRYQGEGTVGERSGAAAPCRNPESLCWSCRLFGSADVVARGENDMARQSAYRGHVRFEDLVAKRDFDPAIWHLAPLSSPSPSAGQFYLDSRQSPRKLADMDTKPAATWGSVADEPRRPIRGRKFYWRTENPKHGEHPRGKFRPGHQSEKLGKRTELIPAGAVFTGRIRFDNLDAADYGSLLAALNPRLLADPDESAWAETVTSIGGAKPFGFGAVRIDVEPEWVQTARTRYLGEEDAVTSPAEAVRQFAEAVPLGVRGNWTSLRNALTSGYVPDDLVWYPAVKGEKGSKEFDESFEFFAEASGVKLKNRDKKLVELPYADQKPGDQVIRWPLRGASREDRGNPHG
jgi:CRISPR/Cas system CSM-associated protein Csm3 (group 7 of RAMP superfamily)